MAELFSGISDTVLDGIQAILYATIYKLLYYLAVGCCWIINLLYSMFEVMAGLSKVSYNGDYDYLINVFFSNTTVSKIYWGMALIGLAVGFAFAIAAVIKKLFDSYEKEKRSYGQILTSLFKTILTIICMSLIITMVLNATTLLMQQITYIFVNADSLDDEEIITYSDEEYAAMTRVYNTIGNFSLNPSYNNRYNLNKCFNEIRFDLQYLKSQGVFDFHYVTTDVEGNTIDTWQSTLQKIANSASLEHDLSLDVYHESTSKAILSAMDLLKVNGSFKPLEDYQRKYMASRNNLSLDRLLFLMASMRAAKNEDYNRSPSLTDPLRGAYYYGEKSIYDLDTVNEDFDIGIAAFDYVILFLTCYKMLETIATIILNCVGRIFNMLLLYLISPIIVAISPMDDGAKFKQWTTAFIVQSFSVFGTVISMRVLLMFIPIIVDPKLVLFENPVGNLLTKLVIILGAFEVSEKATNLITGILADNAGWQSITAGDMSGTAKRAVAKGEAMAKSAVATGVGGAVTAGFGAVKYGGMAGLGVGLAAGYGIYGLGKGAVVGTKALANKISAWRNSGKNESGGAKGSGSGGSGESSSTTNANQQTDSLPSSQRDPQSSDVKEDDLNSQLNNSNVNNGNLSDPNANRTDLNPQGTGNPKTNVNQGSNQGTNINNGKPNLGNPPKGSGVQQQPPAQGVNLNPQANTNKQNIPNQVGNNDGQHEGNGKNPQNQGVNGPVANPNANAPYKRSESIMARAKAIEDARNANAPQGTNQQNPPDRGSNGNGIGNQVNAMPANIPQVPNVPNNALNNQQSQARQNVIGAGVNPQINSAPVNHPAVSQAENADVPNDRREGEQQRGIGAGGNGDLNNSVPGNNPVVPQLANNDVPNNQRGEGQQHGIGAGGNGTGVNSQVNAAPVNNPPVPNPQRVGQAQNVPAEGGNRPLANPAANGPYKRSESIMARAQAIEDARNGNLPQGGSNQQSIPGQGSNRNVVNSQVNTVQVNNPIVPNVSVPNNQQGVNQQVPSAPERNMDGMNAQGNLAPAQGSNTVAQNQSPAKHPPKSLLRNHNNNN